MLFFSLHVCQETKKCKQIVVRFHHVNKFVLDVKFNAVVCDWVKFTTNTDVVALHLFLKMTLLLTLCFSFCVFPRRGHFEKQFQDSQIKVNAKWFFNNHKNPKILSTREAIKNIYISCLINAKRFGNLGMFMRSLTFVIFTSDLNRWKSMENGNWSDGEDFHWKVKFWMFCLQKYLITYVNFVKNMNYLRGKRYF